MNKIIKPSSHLETFALSAMHSTQYCILYYKTDMLPI